MSHIAAISKMSSITFDVVTGSSYPSRINNYLFLPGEEHYVLALENGHPIAIMNDLVPGLMKSAYNKVVGTLNIRQLYKHMKVIASYGSHDEKYAKTMCERLELLLFEWAAIRIQKEWREVTWYNPKFKACQTRLMLEFEELNSQ
jgi:hypothetical protein